MLLTPELFQNGYHLTYFPLGDDARQWVQTENWTDLDNHFKKLTNKEGSLFNFLKRFHDFSSIEFIISVRDAGNDWEEDGIWHDDGSRVFAFSLSLTLDDVQGGRLGIRERGQDHFVQIPTPNFGGIILFLTGIYGYEHKIHQVTKGRRVIIAGWCS